MRFSLAILVAALVPVLAAPAPGQATAGARPWGQAQPARAHTTLLCSVAIMDATGHTVSVRYRGVPGNQAAVNANFVAIWRNSVVPWTAGPLKKVPVHTNGEAGTLVILDIAISNEAYTVGYGVGPRTADVCSTAGLAPDGSAGPLDAVSMSIASLGTNSVTIRYHTLSGYRPASSGNWIGLWQGRASPYDAPPPVARVGIAADVTDDDVRIDGITLRADSPYTLVYFMGPEMTTAAVMINFITPGPPAGTSPAAAARPDAAGRQSIPGTVSVEERFSMPVQFHPRSPTPGPSAAPAASPARASRAS